MVKAERQVFQGQAEAAVIKHFTQGSIIENRQVFDEKRIAEEWFILNRYHSEISLLFVPHTRWAKLTFGVKLSHYLRRGGSGVERGGDPWVAHLAHGCSGMDQEQPHPRATIKAHPSTS